MRALIAAGDDFAAARIRVMLVDKIRRMEPTGSTVGRRFRPFGPESSV